MAEEQVLVGVRNVYEKEGIINLLVEVNAPFFLTVSASDVREWHEADCLPEAMAFKIGEQIAGVIREDFDA